MIDEDEMAELMYYDRRMKQLRREADDEYERTGNRVDSTGHDWEVEE